MVYFLSDGTMIKIGYTNRNVKTRIKELSTGSSTPLYLIGQINNGDKDLETKLHKTFKRVNLEWFESSNSLLEYINQNNDLDVFVDWLNDRLMTYKKMKK